ncbi:hypothetical protein C8R44DRAFT_648154, partial [Mycena epipterygia]
EVIEGDEDDKLHPPIRKELPFRDVAPLRAVSQPQDRAHVSKPTVIKETVAYKLRAPAGEKRQEALDLIMGNIKKQDVTLPMEHLWALAPDLREDLKDMFTKKRIPLDETGKVNLQKHINEKAAPEGTEAPAHEFDPFPSSEYYDETAEQFVQMDAVNIGQLPFNTPFSVQYVADGLVPAGALVANDPVLQYFASIPEGHAPRQVFLQEEQLMGKDSAALRVVHPQIHNQGQEEAILDGGSQIVSMALATARRLGITWDPDINIFMQSANGQVEKTAGLAKNVAFRFGELTVYLQVHIIHEPAYKVLLGRPFEILTACQIQNSTDGGQMITLTDPLSKKRCTLPTFPRGAPVNIIRNHSKSTEMDEDSSGIAEAHFQENSRT